MQMSVTGARSVTSAEVSGPTGAKVSDWCRGQRLVPRFVAGSEISGWC